MKSNYKPIENYIQLVDNRNAGHEVKNLLGYNPEETQRYAEYSVP